MNVKDKLHARLPTASFTHGDVTCSDAYLRVAALVFSTESHRQQDV